MRSHRGVASFLLGLLLVSTSAASQSTRLTDKDVEGLLERIEKQLRGCEAASSPELEGAARTMRGRFDEKAPANEEVQRFLVLAPSLPESPGCAPLLESVSRLAEAYHVDRDMAPALWRARRMNDAELAELLAALGAETGPFTRELEQVVKLLDPCTVVEGEREEAVARARELGRAAEALGKAVARDRDGAAELEALVSTAAEVRAFLERHSIRRVLRDAWAPVARDLALVEIAFGADPS